MKRITNKQSWNARKADRQQLPIAFASYKTTTHRSSLLDHIHNLNLLKISQLADYLRKRVLPNHSEGFTFDPRRLVFPTFAPNSYVVSLFGYERKFTHSPTFVELNKWLTEHWLVIQQQRNYIGGWLDQEYYYLDVSIVIVGLKEALDFARANKQKAIFDPYNGISIPAAPSIAA